LESPKAIFDIDSHNYDVAFKQAVVLFGDKLWDFFGLEFPPIKEQLETESVKVQTEVERSDAVFAMLDGRGAHFEEEVNLSKKDMLRFCGYNVDLSQKYEREFITVIFVRDSTAIKQIESQCLSFRPVIVDCSKKNADEIIKKICLQIERGEPVNELELMYLPLFKSKLKKPEELTVEGVELTKKLPIPFEVKAKMVGTILVLSNKFLDENAIESLWEEFRAMELKIVKVAEQKGIKQGIEQGIERVALNMIKNGMDIDDVILNTGLSQEKVMELQKMQRKAG
jgi:hypothetical protein